MRSDNTKCLPKQGFLDLQGYRPKPSKLPVLKLEKPNRSATPNFTAYGNATQRDREMPNILESLFMDPPIEPKSALNLSTERKYALPTDINVIRIMHDNDAALLTSRIVEEVHGLHMRRARLVLLDKWLSEMTGKHEEESDIIYGLCLKEVIKDITLEFANRGNLLQKIFTGMKEYWIRREQAMEKRVILRESEKREELVKTISSLERECEFFKGGMNDYIDKFMTSEGHVARCEREISVLRMIITRFQQDYKLAPIDFSKISKFVVEDVMDSSKISQFKIVNSIIPRLYKKKQVQTDQTMVVKVAHSVVQTQWPCCNVYVNAIVETEENGMQTEIFRRRPKIFNICTQEPLTIAPRYARTKTNVPFSPTRAFKRQKTRAKYPIRITDDSFLEPEHYSSHVTPNTSIRVSDKLDLPRKKFQFEEGKKSGNDPGSSFIQEFESRVLSACSCKSSSNNSFELNIMPDEKLINFDFNHNRSYTPNPRKIMKELLPHRKPIFQKFKNPAKEILAQCLQLSSKKMAFDALLSIRTLNKTINSMYYSSLQMIRTKQFTSFLEHVFSRLSNKYSLKRMREKRLKDLIASSIKYKSMQAPKMFLRMIGAGKCIGLSNYSINTFKVLLQVLSFFDLSPSGLSIADINGKKICSRTKAIECAKEIFNRRYEFLELAKLLSQIDHQSKNESYGTNREGVVDFEWLVNYLIYSFDFYEKQILAGTHKVIEAITLNEYSICITKAEFMIAIRSIHSDIFQVFEEKNLCKTFGFLLPEVPMHALISIGLIERLALYKGLFKKKCIENFKKLHTTEISELAVDKLTFELDNVSDELLATSMAKDQWQKKLAILESHKDRELSFAIFSCELRRVMNLMSDNNEY